MEWEEKQEKDKKGDCGAVALRRHLVHGRPVAPGAGDVLVLAAPGLRGVHCLFAFSADGLLLFTRKNPREPAVTASSHRPRVVKTMALITIMILRICIMIIMITTTIITTTLLVITLLVMI